jgi:phytoene/squalene synthetase
MDVLDEEHHVSVETIYEAALALQLTHYIQYLRHYVRLGFIPFAQDEMAKFKVTPEMFEQFKTTPEIQQLLEYQMNKVERAYEHVSGELSMYSHTLALNKRLEIARTTLKEIKNSQFKVLEHFINITSLKMWWLSYR